MSFAEEYDDLVVTDKQRFQKACRIFLKQTFIVCDKNEESRKLYFFVKKHDAMFSEYFSYIGFDIRVDQDNKVIMLLNAKSDGVQVNRLRFRKYESIVLCCLWTMYMDQLREGNLTRPIIVSVFDLRQTMEKYGLKEEMEGKGLLKNTLDLFSKYQLISVTGEVGDPECAIRLFASLQFALDTAEFERFVKTANARMMEEKDNLAQMEEEEYAS